LDREEAQLMNRYCDGDARRLPAPLRLIAPRILGLSGGADSRPPAAEDLLQQTFLKLHPEPLELCARRQPHSLDLHHRSPDLPDEIRRRKRAPVKLTADGLPAEQRAAITGQSEEHAGHDGAAIPAPSRWPTSTACRPIRRRP